MDPHSLAAELEAKTGGLVTLWQEGEAWLLYMPSYLIALDFDELDRAIAWRQDALRIYGKEVPLPRLTAWYGDEGTDYVYSGIANHPLPWNPLLLELRDRLVTDLHAPFNAVLLNRYADGLQHMGYHADDEREFGPRPTIASLSFGAERRFLWKRKTKGSEAEKLSLENGSLLVMGGSFQDEFVHAIPKTKLVASSRINLTYRWISGDHR